MLCACQQKRKADQDDPDPTGSGNEFPPWVNCFDSLILYRQGVSLPDELKLSKNTLKELRRIKEWAKRTKAARVQEHEARLPQPAATVVASPPPTMQVQAMRPPTVPGPAPVASPFDPAVLARVAQLRNGPRVGM